MRAAPDDAFVVGAGVFGAGAVVCGPDFLQSVVQMATEKEKSDGGLILPAHLRREEQERVNKALANDPLTVNVSWDPDEGSVTVIYNHPVQVVKMYAEEARKIGRGLIKAAKNAEAKDDKDAAS